MNEDAVNVQCFNGTTSKMIQDYVHSQIVEKKLAPLTDSPLTLHSGKMFSSKRLILLSSSFYSIPSATLSHGGLMNFHSNRKITLSEVFLEP